MNTAGYFINGKKSAPGWVERTGYGLGCLGINMILSVLTDYIIIYMTDVVLLDIAVISTIIAVSKFFDGVSDLTVGYIVDHTSSPLGKARPWLLAMCIPFALTSWLLFFVPGNWSVSAKYIYVFIMYNLVSTVCLTFLMISSFSMVSLISEDREEQGLLSVIQSTFSNIGILLGTPLFVKVMLYFSKDAGNQGSQQGYSIAVLIYGIAMVFLVVVSVFTTRERASSTGTRSGSIVRQEGKSHRLESIKTLISDKYWLTLTVTQIISNLGSQCMIMGGAYYASYILHDMGQMSWMTATIFGPSLLAKPLIPPVMKRIGKRRTFALSCAILAASSLGFGLVAPWKAGMIVCNAIRGLGVGFGTGIQLGIVADLVRKTEKEKGVDAPGLGNASFSTATKVGKGLGSVCFGFAMAAAGFSASPGSQNTAPASLVNNVITSTYCWVPTIIFALLFIVYTFFFNYEAE